MSKIAYITKRFNTKSRILIDRADQIIDDYQAQGMDLTVRQLFYRFVTKGYLENTQKEYKKLVSLISNARLAGLIDWHAIVDRTRNLEGNTHWDSPEGVITSAAHSFALDKWENQPNRVEVWVEKEALAGVLDKCCPDLDVDYFSCRGYVSQSEQWGAAMRLGRYDRYGQRPHIIHLGDHDPSGIDMTRDIIERINATFGVTVEVHRIALNMDQVEAYAPPPNPAKTTDSRFQDYRRVYGEDSWELDALEPTILMNLIRDAVLNLRDPDLWDEMKQREDEQKEVLFKIDRNFDAVSDLVNDLEG